MAELEPRSSRGRRAHLVVTLVCTLGCMLSLLSGCAGSQQGAGTPARASVTGNAPTDLSGAAVGATGTFNSTDIAWLQLLIAMDDQTRHILELAPRHVGEPALKRWAADVARDNLGQLKALRKLLATAGIPDTNPHEGHDMPGMVDAGELEALADATGPEFDRLLRSALREHLTQAEHLSNGVRDSGSDTRVRKLAAAVKNSAADQRRSMPT
ncbi:DUF305 domain-containing protein [Streptomyces sp. NPDC057757]|uniref:DUF305 domain-containing protein n=1 Tax=Streptomyces sp. NPDC057757 TaxID=3346241 RepID=UPI0036922DFE